jgi:hypothetical protein
VRLEGRLTRYEELEMRIKLLSANLKTKGRFITVLLIFIQSDVSS